ncbi:hypothetical protein [Paenibacillus sp. UMB4589-SE434]|uniref:hypothetical protein n=1 Tax=Paenibacillus sp. UMB4589-SE434 TaxID=3046314 RepID=UPI0025505D5A|nr:hypothetical protein [Paenibacillus sp. UMB4589-SE434]MDK8179942.1 hypothetical protein [Paenibacillus sp. UMB4589-SE434]
MTIKNDTPKRVFLLTLLLLFILPSTLLANGAFSSYETKNATYKQVNSFFKMPDYMYANPHTGITLPDGASPATIPTIFFTFEVTEPYAIMDIGLMFLDGGWKVEYLAKGATAVRSDEPWKVWSALSGNQSITIGTPAASLNTGKSGTVLNHQANQLLQMNAYITDLTKGPGLRYEVYNESGTLLVRSDVPITTTVANKVKNEGASWTREFAMASNLPTNQYIADGSYAWNAQFQKGWVIGTNGTWYPWNDTYAKPLAKKIEEFGTSIPSQYANKISVYSANNPISPYKDDYVNINYNSSNLHLLSPLSSIQVEQPVQSKAIK